jgi:large subunit ribosomal protein L33
MAPLVLRPDVIENDNQYRTLSASGSVQEYPTRRVAFTVPSSIGAGPAPEERGQMAKRNDVRPIIKLRSTAGTGFTYVTRKNRRNDPDRLTMRKYDPVVRQHVDFREER